MKKFLAVVLLTCAFLQLPTTLKAQSYSWITRSAGVDGSAADGATTVWDWIWEPGDLSITGNLSITRSGAGQTYNAWENFETTLISSLGKFRNHPYFQLGINGSIP